MIYAAGSALAFFLSVVLLGKKGKSRADNILLLWMLLLGIHMALFYAVYIELSDQYPLIFCMALPFPFMHGPFLYLYTTAKVDRYHKNRLKTALHFLPAIGIYIYYIPFMFAEYADQMAVVAQIRSGNADLLFRSISFLLIVSGVSYIVATLLVLRKHKASLSDESQFSEQPKLNWLRNLILGMSAIWTLVILVSFLDKDNGMGDNIIYGSVVLFIISIGYFGIRQPDVFRENAQVVPSTKELTTNSVKQKRYEKSGLKEEQVQNIAASLQKLMTEEQLFLDGEISLKVLSEKLELPSNHVSQVINQHFQKNFHDFINGYRLAAFQERIAQQAHEDYTILTIAYDCGFNSKATFNKFFKKELGVSPSSYIRANSEK